MAYAPELYIQPIAQDGTTGSYRTITFPAGVELSAIEDNPVRLRDGVAPPVGLPRFASYGVSRTLTIEVGPLAWQVTNHRTFLLKLMAVDSALSLGAIAHFTWDRPRRGAWALRNSADLAYAVPALGDTTVYRRYVAGSPVDLFGSSDPGGGSLVATDTDGRGDDVVCIETAGPESHAHYARATAIDPGARPRGVDLDIAYLHDTSASRAYMRWWGFYPALTLSDASLGAPRLTNMGGGALRYMWRATFTMSPQRVFDLFP